MAAQPVIQDGDGATIARNWFETTAETEKDILFPFEEADFRYEPRYLLSSIRLATTIIILFTIDRAQNRNRNAQNRCVVPIFLP
ncbi:hypothetical protein WN55_02552 [Dufourea novaeangliae]|uniref:Uncharacterized protein n=1 Tax=Dufourea novaeangliae TaxID=178035 RepID=A0A154PHP3_DUFNO|nr:hypothetical protein WN55_02552 [Dufourea novaeangliae]